MESDVKKNELLPEGPIFQRKTFGDANPRGKARIYFCCHKDDFDLYFTKVTDELLEIRKDAAIWYRDPKMTCPNNQAFLDDLDRMQLFVAPITSKFLHEDDPGRTVEFDYAVKHNIPILPMMQEPDLMDEFNKICGTRQFLDEAMSRKDKTAIPYLEKLKNFLEAVLVGDELAEKIREAFAAYIFLSYRKKDRAEAQRVMRLIHENEFCQDVAIWYDEFLTLGEDFNEEIKEAMRKSQIFALVVTPSLLENPNYVQEHEYPDAVALGKDIVPVEAVSTDSDELARMYDNIAAYEPSGDPKKIAERLRKILINIAIRETENDPAHNYLIGLAYLSGIDVEKNDDRAVKLITSAAEAGLPEACEKMVRMYYYGDGVKKNVDKAIEWQARLIKTLFDRARAEGYDENLYTRISNEYCRLGNMDKDIMAYRNSELAYDRMLDFANILIKKNAKGSKNVLALAYCKIGDIKLERARKEETINGEDLEQVRLLYEEALRIYQDILSESETVEAKSDVARTYGNIGYLCLDERKLIDNETWKNEKALEAKEMYQKDVEIEEELLKEEDTSQRRYSLMLALEGLGHACISTNEKDEARQHFKRYRDLAKQNIKETDSVQSYDDYGIGLFSLVGVSEGHDAAIYLMEYKNTYEELYKRTGSMKYEMKKAGADLLLKNVLRKLHFSFSEIQFLLR